MIISISLQEEIFKGNLLDMGMENYGIIYNAYKLLNEEISVDYLSGRAGECGIRKGYYNNCILLLSLNKILLNKNKLGLLQEIKNYLSDKGTLHIWDMEKPRGKIWNNIIRIETPDKRVKEINLREINVFKDNSLESTLKLVRNYFEIIDFNCKDGLYYIKANKISGEKELNEDCTGSS